jgi:SPP1 gp7 family putative phage head morphogenesis protein
MEVTRRQAATVVRTAVSHVVNQARELTYKTHKKVIKGVRWLSTLDGKTSDICISLDGQVFGIYEGPRPPAHHQCRSMTVPVIKSWKELGINLKQAKPGTRASMNGQVPAKMKYGEWLKTQPKSFQNEVLGRRKAELFRRGNVPVSRFIDNKLRPLTLRQLEAIEAHKLKTGRLPRRPPVRKKVVTTKKVIPRKKVVTKKRVVPRKKVVTKKKAVTKKVARSTAQRATMEATAPVAEQGVATHEMPGSQLAKHMDEVLGPKVKEIERLQKQYEKARAASEANHALIKDRQMEITRRLQREWEAKTQMRLQRTGSRGPGQPGMDEIRDAWRADPVIQNAQGRLRPLFDAMDDASNAVRAAEDQVTKEMHKMLELPKSRRANWKPEHTKFTSQQRNRKIALDEGQEWCERMYDRDVLFADLKDAGSHWRRDMDNNVFRFRYNKLRSDRSYHLEGDIHISPHAQARTVVHELGHKVEFHNNNSLGSSINFLKKRIREAQARGESVRKLRDIYGDTRYKHHEIAWEDRFEKAYTGKVYTHFDAAGANFRSSEIMSMGTEEMFANPWGFLKADREFFEFVVDGMRGRGNWYGSQFTDDYLSSTVHTSGFTP